MKKTINKILALICTMALVVSMCSFVTVFAASQVQIITAQFMPYEGQIKLLASLDEGYTDAKVYVNGQQITVTPDVRDDGNIVFTSTAFNPSAYGIATVKLEANVGGTTYSDTQNIKIYKVTSKTNAFSENFDQLEKAAMSDCTATNTNVKDLLANSSAVTAINFPSTSNKTLVSISDAFNEVSNDNKFIVFDLNKFVTGGLAGIRIMPNTVKSGLVEISYDMLNTETDSRVSMYIYGGNNKTTYSYNSTLYPRTSVDASGNLYSSGAYYVKHHQYNRYAFSDKKYQTNQWDNIRFLMNLDELTYEFYVNAELVDSGKMVVNTSASTTQVGFSRVEFQINGYPDSQVALDNINVNYLGFAPFSYSKEADITSNLSFDNSVDSASIAITAQNPNKNGNMGVAKKQGTIGGESALSFYFTKPSTETGTVKGKKTFFTIHSINEKKSGRIVIEHDLYLTDANATLNYELNDKTSSGKLTFYPLQDNTLFAGGKISTTTCDYSDGWNTVKIVLDFQKGCTEVYFDNALINTNNSLLTGTTAGSGNPVDTFQAVRINYSPSTEPATGVETFAFAIDNWRVYQELPVSEITGVTSYDLNGNSAAVVNTGVVSTDTDKFEIALTNTEYCDETSLEANAKVLADGVEVQDAVSLSDATLTVDVSNVPAHADLQLVIGKDTLLYDGTTTIGADIVFNLKTANENGVYIKRDVSANASNVSADCKLDVLSGSKNVVVVLALYDGDELVGITSRTVEGLSGAKSLSLTLPATDATSVKVFVWDNLETGVIPYESEVIYSISSQN